jgi:hypothetical protein
METTKKTRTLHPDALAMLVVNLPGLTDAALGEIFVRLHGCRLAQDAIRRERDRRDYSARVDAMLAEWLAAGKPLGYDYDRNLDAIKRDYPSLFGPR